MNIIPVNLEYHEEYTRSLESWLREENIRVSADYRNEKLSYKMRESVVKKIPVTVIIGQKEVDSDTVSYRLFGSEETTTVSKDEFLNYLKNRIESRN